MWCRFRYRCCFQESNKRQASRRLCVDVTSPIIIRQTKPPHSGSASRSSLPRGPLGTAPGNLETRGNQPWTSWPGNMDKIDEDPFLILQARRHVSPSNLSKDTVNSQPMLLNCKERREKKGEELMSVGRVRVGGDRPSGFSAVPRMRGCTPALLCSTSHRIRSGVWVGVILIASRIGIQCKRALLDAMITRL